MKTYYVYLYNISYDIQATASNLLAHQESVKTVSNYIDSLPFELLHRVKAKDMHQLDAREILKDYLNNPYVVVNLVNMVASNDYDELIDNIRDLPDEPLKFDFSEIPEEEDYPEEDDEEEEEDYPEEDDEEEEEYLDEVDEFNEVDEEALEEAFYNSDRCELRKECKCHKCDTNFLDWAKDLDNCEEDSCPNTDPDPEESPEVEEVEEEEEEVEEPNYKALFMKRTAFLRALHHTILEALEELHDYTFNNHEEDFEEATLVADDFIDAAIEQMLNYVEDDPIAVSSILDYIEEVIKEQLEENETGKRD